MGTVSHGNSLWLRLTLAKLIAICAAIWSSVRFIHMRTFEAEVSNITASAKKAAVCTACVRAPNYTAGCFNPVAKKRVISFAFYQSPDTGRPRDCDRLGILHNLRLMRIVYPGWRMRIYMSDNIRISLVDYLRAQPDVEIVPYASDPEASALGRTKRFLVAQDRDVDCFLVRDLDSRLILRERFAVDAWLDTTDKKVCGLYLWSDCTLDGFFLNSDFMEAKADEFVTLRDHEGHRIPVLGGMWGGRGVPVPDMQRHIADVRRYISFDDDDDDQRFLNSFLWAHAIGRSVVAYDVMPGRLAGLSPVFDFPKAGRDSEQWSSNSTYRHSNYVGNVAHPAETTYECDFEKEQCWVISMDEKALLRWIDDNPVRWCTNTCRCD